MIGSYTHIVHDPVRGLVCRHCLEAIRLTIDELDAFDATREVIWIREHAACVSLKKTP
jgi:hypothetical protein